LPTPNTCRLAQALEQTTAHTEAVYGQDEVERLPAPARDNPVPAWPKLLGTESLYTKVTATNKDLSMGVVKIAFVVDSIGCTDPSRYKVLVSLWP
jgi:hypothetical protein